MYKNLLWVLLCIIWLYWLAFSSWEYLTQWFQYYQVQGDSIDFVCQWQCLLVLWKRWSNDILKIDNLTGQWLITIWAMDIKKNIHPISQHQYQSTITVYIDQLAWQEIPQQSDIIIHFQWNIRSYSWSAIVFAQSNRIDDLSMAWKTFRSREWQTFYGINLRYGAKFWSRSIVSIWYIIFIFILVYLTIKRKISMINMLYVWVWLYLLLAIRTQIDYSLVTIDWIKSYTIASTSKMYGNLWSYYDFITQARGILNLDRVDDMIPQCRIFFDCAQERPYCTHMEAVFMKPCEKSINIIDSNYQIYYGKIPTNPRGQKILDYQWSFLYQTK